MSSTTDVKRFRADATSARIVERLTNPDTRNTISKICEVTGVVGLSVGVIHNGKVIYQDHFGHRDHDKKYPPDSHSTYHIGSMSKAMVAAAFASLVHQGKVNWSTPLSELVPEYATSTSFTRLPELKTKANVEDLLAMRMGLPTGNGLWIQSSQQLLVPKVETARIVGFLEPQLEFRQKMSYCNWCYALAGEILERLCDSSIEHCTKNLLYDPLDLRSTTFGKPTKENHVSAYMTLADLSSIDVPCPPLCSGRVLAGAGAAKSSLADLLAYYKVLLESAADQKNSGESETEGSPFFHTEHIWGPRAAIDENSYYGLGWVGTRLPGQSGLVSVNSNGSSGNLPIIAKGIPKPTQLVYHNGAMAGALSAVYLLPETQTGIVVLSNTFALCDAPDWIAQYLVEIILDSPERNDFVELAKEAAVNALHHYEETRRILAQERIIGTKSRELIEYTGRYYNSIKNFHLDVTISGDKLRMVAQGYQAVNYDLQHYNYDVFSWDCDRDAQTRKRTIEAQLGNFDGAMTAQIPLERSSSKPPMGIFIFEINRRLVAFPGHVPKRCTCTK
ncbi:hypothetical protein M426DRAFT_19038 [Hypoxylon sp. CI-4A]|nr:hypothetical protein M426DRAFT_19038 [Hypoxylon sp. CI-4A]